MIDEPLKTRCREIFPRWMRSLGADAVHVATSLVDLQSPNSAKATLAAGLLYLIQVDDLVSDLESTVGLLDDALVLRAAVALAAKQDPSLRAQANVFARLEQEAALVREVMGESAPHLDQYIAGMALSDARVANFSAQAVASSADEARRLGEWMRRWASQIEFLTNATEIEPDAFIDRFLRALVASYEATGEVGRISG